MLLDLPSDLIKEIIGYIVKVEDIYRLIQTGNRKLVKCIYEGVKQLGKEKYVYSNSKKVESRGLRKLVNIEYIYYDVIVTGNSLTDISQLKKVKNIRINIKSSQIDQHNFLDIVKEFLEEYNTDINGKSISIDLIIKREKKMNDEYCWKWFSTERGLNKMEFDVDILDSAKIEQLIALLTTCQKYGRVECMHLEDISYSSDLINFVTRIKELKCLSITDLCDIDPIVTTMEIIEPKTYPTCRSIMDKRLLDTLGISETIKVFNVGIFCPHLLHHHSHPFTAFCRKRM